jgi:hypothetical protein
VEPGANDRNVVKAGPGSSRAQHFHGMTPARTQTAAATTGHGICLQKGALAMI